MHNTVIIELVCLYIALMTLISWGIFFSRKILDTFQDILEKEYQRGWNNARREYRQVLRDYAEASLNTSIEPLSQWFEEEVVKDD